MTHRSSVRSVPQLATGTGHSGYRRSAFAALLMVMLLSAWMDSNASQLQKQEDIPSEIRQMIAAAGGSKWDAVTTLTGMGEKTSFGLTGKFRMQVSLVTGSYQADADYGLFANADGVDRVGRWRQDNSGQVHPLDSPEGQAVAVSESYLARHGYFFPQRLPADFRLVGPITEGTRRYVRIEVTPKHGRALVLWSDATSHLLDRAVMELSVGVETIRYGDYRPVEGLMLPFRISVERRDENETGTAVIRNYQIGRTAPTEELMRPAAVVSDVGMSADAKAAAARGYFDRDSGFFIVMASINGKGPYPFILDTGGHNILTPRMVKHVGLTTQGKGFTTGAGTGSATTEFTKISSVAIGSAVLPAQPFVILHLDLGTTQDGKRQQPIAGILGLEVFERFAITMNFKDQTVTLHPLSQFIYAGTGQRVSLCFTNDMPLVQATLDGHPGWFGVDTGNNTDLIVFQHWVESNGLAPVYRNAAKIEGSSVGGSVDLGAARAKSFQIGDMDVGSVRILLASGGAGSLSARFEAGNFGNSILSHFTVTFDYHSEAMYLEPLFE